jgi:hypothetical protein
MITERDFLTHMGSIWNSRKIRTGVFASSTEKKFLLVEGKLDAVLVSSMGEEIPFTPIAREKFRYRPNKTKASK